MSDYPNQYPLLPIVVPGVSYPKTEDSDLPNREIEAIATELGTNPRSISDAVSPSHPPASVAAYLDMIANIFKAISGAANWYQASVPIRRVIGGSGAIATIAASTINYAFVFGRGLSATENLTHGLMAYAGVIKNLYVILSTAQPATGSLVFTLRKDQTDTGLVLTVAAGAVAGIYSVIGSVAFERGNKIGLKIANNATGVSAQINGWTCECDQNG